VVSLKRVSAELRLTVADDGKGSFLDAQTQLFADHAGDLLANYGTRIVFAEHPILDEIDGVQEILGVLIHRPPVHYTCQRKRRVPLVAVSSRARRALEMVYGLSPQRHASRRARTERRPWQERGETS
jgi:hypothetical protein